MRVIILGSAAGGGLPQWNCGCGNCQDARLSGTGRTQSSVALSADGARWVLLNASPAHSDAPPLPPQGVDLGQWEKSVIEQAMREAGGNQTKAARRLGISRDTLRYRLRKFGLQP